MFEVEMPEVEELKAWLAEVRREKWTERARYVDAAPEESRRFSDVCLPTLMRTLLPRVALTVPIAQNVREYKELLKVRPRVLHIPHIHSCRPSLTPVRVRAGFDEQESMDYADVGELTNALRTALREHKRQLWNEQLGLLLADPDPLVRPSPSLPHSPPTPCVARSHAELGAVAGGVDGAGKQESALLDHVQRGEALRVGANELEQLRQRIKQLRVAQQIESAAGGRGPHAPRAPGELDDRAVSSLLMSLMAPEQLSPSAYGGAAAGSGAGDAGAAGAAAGAGKGSPAAAGSAKKRKSLAGADADGAPKKRKAAAAPEAGGSGSKPKSKRAKQDAASEEKGAGMRAPRGWPSSATANASPALHPPLHPPPPPPPSTRPSPPPPPPLQCTACAGAPTRSCP